MQTDSDSEDSPGVAGPSDTPEGASAPTLDVVAVGNALVDVLASATDAALAALDLVKGTMALVDHARSEAIYATMGPTTEASGGSAWRAARSSRPERPGSMP